MHADCTLCTRLNRASAYRWLGEPHWIPGLHGANWLDGDLRAALAGLALGQELELDYRGETPGAPRIVVHRSAEDVITAQGLDGWLELPGRTRWRWLPGSHADRSERIVFTLLSFLRERREARSVILVPPH